MSYTEEEVSKLKGVLMRAKATMGEWDSVARAALHWRDETRPSVEPYGDDGDLIVRWPSGSKLYAEYKLCGASKQASAEDFATNLEGRIVQMAEEYELRGDEGDYTPNERERFMLLDFAHEVAEALAAQQQPQANPNLHPRTADLVQRFAAALAEKLAAAEAKYGYSDHWSSPDWMDECRAKLAEHVAKGDPRDVAAYCAFLWHHGERTAAPQPQSEDLEALAREMFYAYQKDDRAVPWERQWRPTKQYWLAKACEALAAKQRQAPSAEVLANSRRYEWLKSQAGMAHLRSIVLHQPGAWNPIIDAAMAGVEEVPRG